MSHINTHNIHKVKWQQHYFFVYIILYFIILNNSSFNWLESFFFIPFGVVDMASQTKCMGKIIIVAEHPQLPHTNFFPLLFSFSLSLFFVCHKCCLLNIRHVFFCGTWKFLRNTTVFLNWNIFTQKRLLNYN